MDCTNLSDDGDKDSFDQCKEDYTLGNPHQGIFTNSNDSFRCVDQSHALFASGSGRGGGSATGFVIVVVVMVLAVIMYL